MAKEHTKACITRATEGNEIPVLCTCKRIKPNRYTHLVAISTEDGTDYLCERNGVTYSYSECGKRYSEEKAREVRDAYVASHAGHGTEYGISVVRAPRQSRGAHRRYVKYREKERRIEAVLFDRMYQR